MSIFLVMTARKWFDSRSSRNEHHVLCSIIKIETCFLPGFSLQLFGGWGWDYRRGCLQRYTKVRVRPTDLSWRLVTKISSRICSFRWNKSKKIHLEYQSERQIVAKMTKKFWTRLSYKDVGANWRSRGRGVGGNHQKPMRGRDISQNTPNESWPLVFNPPDPGEMFSWVRGSRWILPPLLPSTPPSPPPFFIFSSWTRLGACSQHLVASALGFYGGRRVHGQVSTRLRRWVITCHPSPLHGLHVQVNISLELQTRYHSILHHNTPVKLRRYPALP